jgi:hypothetical protein
MRADKILLIILCLLAIGNYIEGRWRPRIITVNEGLRTWFYLLYGRGATLKLRRSVKLFFLYY